MSIQVFDHEDELDDAFNDAMEALQEEERLSALICEAEERVAAALDELAEAESELADLKQQLDDVML